MIVGYARVSTDGQTLDAQQSALAAAGAERVFAEKISGVVTDRRALGRAIAALGPGDVLLVTRLDRLARSTRDLLNVLDAVSRAGAGFRSLADTWADTTTPHGKLMITILGGLAEFERSLILARTSEGRIRAKARGVAFEANFSCLGAHEALPKATLLGLFSKIELRRVTTRGRRRLRPLRNEIFWDAEEGLHSGEAGSGGAGGTWTLDRSAAMDIGVADDEARSSADRAGGKRRGITATPKSPRR